MVRATQKRTLETRARLIAAAEAIVDEVGYEALRVEEVVLRAGTAKGTFFVHFKDKERMMDIIIGPRIDAYLDAIKSIEAPLSVAAMTAALTPLIDFMTCERYVFEIILRYSGAATETEIGPIATTFGRQIEVFTDWFRGGNFRSDVPPELLAEGVQAFMFQAMAANFCALHNSQTVTERLEPYLHAWLLPSQAS